VLLIRPKFFLDSNDSNPDLSEATWEYWAYITKFHEDRLHAMASEKSGRSTGSLEQFARETPMKMQTYRQALFEAHIKARKRGYSRFRESCKTLDTNMTVEYMVTWFEELNIEPQEFMDITITGANAKFIVPSFGEEGLIFPDDPREAWWPNNHNIPAPDKWALTRDSYGEPIVRSKRCPN
jgi:hypothetical protein